MERGKFEENILKQGLNALRKETGLIAHELPARLNIPTERWDGEIALVVPGQDEKINFFLGIKRRVTQAIIGAIVFQFQQTKGRAVLMTKYVNPILAFELKELGIQFIDTCGNAYLDTFPIYVFVKGNKPVTDKERLVVAPRAFRPKGLKVVYALFCHPGLENMPFRQIAAKADVALGTVNAVLKNLHATGYLVDQGRHGRTLVRKDKLFDRWVATYPDTLRPTLTVGRYTAKDNYWWENYMLPDFFYWGGEVAAAKLTKYLKPEVITIYTHKAPAKLLFQNKMKRDPNGEIEILKAFWDEDDYWGQNMVHPLLVYTDLLATNDARNHETAKIIYENELYRFIK